MFSKNSEVLKIAEKVKGGNIIDIGAHIGTFTLALSALCKIQNGIAIKPSPKNFALLKKNLTINGLTNCHCEQAACYSSSGEMDFYEDTKNTALGSLRAGGTRRNSIKIKVKTIDNLVPKTWKSIALLKVDAEGADLDVLSGAKKTLKITEIVFVDVGLKEEHEEITSFLKKYGFSRVFDASNFLVLVKSQQ
jgi:FkbM family methyltransferase